MYKKKLLVLVGLFYCIKSFALAHCPANSPSAHDWEIDNQSYWVPSHAQWRWVWCLLCWSSWSTWELNKTSIDIANARWEIKENSLHKWTQGIDQQFPMDAQVIIRITNEGVTCTYVFPKDATPDPTVLTVTTTKSVNMGEFNFNAWFKNNWQLEYGKDVYYCHTTAGQGDQECLWMWA